MNLWPFSHKAKTPVNANRSMEHIEQMEKQSDRLAELNKKKLGKALRLSAMIGAMDDTASLMTHAEKPTT